MECVICFESIDQPTLVKPCEFHKLHDICVARWVHEDHDTCPVCRRPLLNLKEYEKIVKVKQQIAFYMYTRTHWIFPKRYDRIVVRAFHHAYKVPMEDFMKYRHLKGWIERFDTVKMIETIASTIEDEDNRLRFIADMLNECMKVLAC